MRLYMYDFDPMRLNLTPFWRQMHRPRDIGHFEFRRPFWILTNVTVILSKVVYVSLRPCEPYFHSFLASDAPF